MVLQAKLAVPRPSPIFINRTVLEQALGGKNTLFSATAGFFDSGSLATILTDHGIRTAWLRLGPEDNDPASLLLSLVYAAQTVEPACGAVTLEKMRRQPGPIYGWAPLYTSLAREMYETLPKPTALVIEHLHLLGNSPETLNLLWYHLLPLLPAGMVRILTRDSPMRRFKLPPFINLRGQQDLQMDNRSGLSLARMFQLTMPDATLHRLMELAGGRQVLLTSLLTACSQMGVYYINRLIQTSGNRTDLLSRVARALLDGSPPGSEDLLSLALQIDYLNPSLNQLTLGRSLDPPGEFLQPLSDDWAYLHNVWRNPLETALKTGGFTHPGIPDTMQKPQAVLERAVEYLIRQGCYEQAISKLLALGNPYEAARVIVQVSEVMLDRGQWKTLSGWLNQLPEEARHEWPWLVYIEGELSAGKGHEGRARQIFAGATRLFIQERDMTGACQSLLTESCLAAWKEDMVKARELAHQAQSLAETHGLVWHQGWAGWQLGVLAISSNNPDEALIHLNNASAAAAATADKQLIHFIGKARQLAQTEVSLLQKIEQHRREINRADHEKQEVADQLRYLVESPTEHTDQLLTIHGWSRMPLMAKLPTPAAKQTGGLADLLRGLLGMQPNNKNRRMVQPTAELDQPDDRFTTVTDSTGPENRSQSAILPQTGAAAQTDLTIDQAGDGSLSANQSPGITKPLDQNGALIHKLPAESPGNKAFISLNAYLLGAFRLLLDDQTIENWPSGRGKSIFAYLLAQGGKPVPRDVIMETFWPESVPEAARNNLNVAIHGLRRALKPIISQPVVIFQDNAYHLNHDLGLWLDIVEFERHVQNGRRWEAQAQVSQAIREYEAALSLYQGDMLADSPYEDWPAIERERLRVQYMETLDRLSLVYFNTSQYAACINLCQFLLARDSCREDAHCRLMRSYSRQGQHHMALRQYQTCVQMLRDELDVEPSPATTQLYEKIRRRDQV